MKKTTKKNAAKKVVKKASKPTAQKKVIAKPASTNKSGVTPLGDRVLVKPIVVDDTTTSFGIIIPDTVSKEKPEQGTVIAVGMGKKNDEGKLIPLSVQVGDKIMFSKYGFDEIKVDGVEYYILPESSILAIIN